MRHFMRVTKLALAFTVLFGQMSFAAEGSPLRLLAFRFGGFAMYQTGGNAYSGIIDYVPAYNFYDTLGVRLNLGGTLLKSKSGDKNPVIEYGLLLTWRIGQDYAVEVGGGKQNFVMNGGSHWAINANVAHHYKERLLYLFDHAYFGYTAGLVPTLFSHEFRLGLGIGF